MLRCVVLVVALVAAVNGAATCATAGKGPCINSGGVHLCPDNSACIIDTTNDANSICCDLSDIQPGGAVTTASPTACVDKLNPSTGVSDCPKSAYLCNNPAYYDLMTQQCPKTCNRCGAVGTVTVPSTTCQDKLNPQTGVSDCPASAYLCQNPTYKPLMKDQCPKTCGYCH